MTDYNYTDSEKQEIFKFLLESEEQRTGEKLNAREKHSLLKITTFTARMLEQITKFMPDQPEQWIAAGNSILFSAVHDYLKLLDQVGELNAENKARVRLGILSQMARIMAMIDCYPDKYEQFSDFRNLSHDQFRQWLDEEYKKWLT